MTDLAFVPLRPEERALLDDPDRASEFAAIPLSGRLVEHLTIQALRWQSAVWERTRMCRVRWVECHFHAVSFKDSELEHCEFERCTFTDCRFEQSRLMNARFVDCELREALFRETELVDTSLQGSILSGPRLELARVSVSMSGGELSQARFGNCQVVALQLTETRVQAVRFSSCAVQRVRLHRCAAEGLHVLRSEVAEFQLVAGSLRDAKWADVAGERIELVEMAEVISLYLNACRIAQLTIRACVGVHDLYVYESDLQQLHVETSRVSGSFKQSRLGAGSRIAHGVLADLFLDDSQCQGLTLEQVTLTGGLCARNTRFVGLRIRGLAVPADFEWVLAGATFHDSDTFPGAGP